MHYEKTTDESFPHWFSFEDSETEALRAAYREHIFFLAQEGDTASIGDFEVGVSGWEDDGRARSFGTLFPYDIAEVLESFADRTEDAIQEIPDLTHIPAYASDDVGERLRLGRLATVLAAEIREKTSEDETPAPAEEEPALEEQLILEDQAIPEDERQALEEQLGKPITDEIIYKGLDLSTE